MTATLSWAGSIRIVFSDRQFCVQKSLSKVTDSNGKWPLKKRCQPYEQRGRVNILVLLYCRTAFFGPNVQTQEYPRPSRLFANNLHIQVNICSVFHLTRPVRGSSKSLFGEFLQYYLFWRSWNVTLNITSQSNIFLIIPFITMSGSTAGKFMNSSFCPFPVCRSKYVYIFL